MSKTADEILDGIVVSIAKHDRVYEEGDTIIQLLEKIRVRRQQRRQTQYNHNPVGESKKMTKKRQEAEKLAIGSRACWVSQAQGTAHRVEGKILAYVPRGQKVPLEGLIIPVPSRMKFKPEEVSSRDRYLVEIIEKTTIRYATPIASQVAIVVEP